MPYTEAQILGPGTEWHKPEGERSSFFRPKIFSGSKIRVQGMTICTEFFIGLYSIALLS